LITARDRVPPFVLGLAPSPAGRRLTRANLVHRIEADDRPLLLVVAPSGFGKTNLLAEWARSTTANVAWLTCEPADQDPEHFWSRFAATVADRWPSAGNDATLLLLRPSWEQPELVDALAGDLADISDLGAIVLDDSQYAESSQRMLAMLARQLPPNLRMIMASQHNPAFSTSRMQLEGVVAELRADDLSFSRAELDDLFRLAGLTVAADDRQRLHELTEGWPAGLQMAALALRHSEDPGGVVDAFSSTTRETNDYLANEVLAGLDADLTDFMARISILDEFDAELCQAVTGQSAARFRLAEIVANDLFIYQVDYAGERFRFHQMFAAYLRTRLKELGGTAYRQAHDLAGQALLERGDRLGALRHAMAVADVSRAATIVDESIARTLEVDDAREAIAVARAWLSRYGDTAPDEDPEHFLQFVFLLATFGQREAERWLVTFERTHPSPDAHIAAMAHMAWGNFHLNRGNAEAVLAHNRLAVDATFAAPRPDVLFPKLAELALQEAGAHLLTGDLDAASAALERRSPALAAPIVDEVRSPAYLQWITFMRGDLVSAEQVTAQLRRAAVEHAALPHEVGMLRTALFQVGLHLEREEITTAAALLTQLRDAAEFNGRPGVQTHVNRWLARCETARGNRTSAMAALTEARLVLRGQSDSVRAQLVAEELRILIALAPEEAHVLVSRLPDDTATWLLRAQLAVQCRDLPAAAAILADIAPTTIREWVEWEVLTSLAVRERDLPKAHAYLLSAVQRAQPHRYVATIVRSGPGIDDLLRSMPTPVAQRSYVGLLLASANRHHPRPEDAPPTDELLTARELDVLRLLASRLTTQEIADSLFVSRNTLKSHTKGIYQKLQVNSRSEAVGAWQARGSV
jgi:LuxR family maltose regulon positive regulatory protein